MKNFHSNRGGGGNRFGGGGGGGGRSFGGGGGGFNRTQERNEMHDAVCATCHQNCQVPFRPSGSKPVYCSDCFRRDGDTTRSPRFGGGGGGGGRPDDRGFTRQEKQIFYVTCDKCGVDCDVPFKPNGSKPVYCRGCFDKGGDSSSAPRRDFTAPRRDSNSSASAPAGPSNAKQLKEINEKLDMLIDLITEAAGDFDEDGEEMIAETDDSIETAVEEVIAEVATEEATTEVEAVEEVVETTETPEEIVAKVVEDIDDLGDFDSIK